MKKVILAFLIISILILPAMSIGAPVPDDVINTTLGNVASWLKSIVLALALIFLFIGAMYFILARGDADKVKTAQQMVIWSLIGVIVVVLASGLITLVQGWAGQST